MKQLLINVVLKTKFGRFSRLWIILEMVLSLTFIIIGPHCIWTSNAKSYWHWNGPHAGKCWSMGINVSIRLLVLLPASIIKTLNQYINLFHRLLSSNRASIISCCVVLQPLKCMCCGFSLLNAMESIWFVLYNIYISVTYYGECRVSQAIGTCTRGTILSAGGYPIFLRKEWFYFDNGYLYKVSVKVVKWD